MDSVSPTGGRRGLSDDVAGTFGRYRMIALLFCTLHFELDVVGGSIIRHCRT
jgi:hypothetical protein